MDGTNLEPEWKKPLALPDLPAEDVLSAFLTYMVSFASTVTVNFACSFKVEWAWGSSILH
eukprot:1560839-Pyramimonas_sp.AAC.2